ncbi:MAG: threonine--tRNA ligase [Candidatus Altiarchaeota archaeon]|nr:threonine--tRNA ligase [Candidatus Altiarchaeota archaeon]
MVKTKTEGQEHKASSKKTSKDKAIAQKEKNDLKSNVELGRELDLYITSELVGQGLPLLTSKGATFKREIERFVMDEEIARGHLHTSTPIMAKSDLYKISGHWAHYKDSMFCVKMNDETYALRPMACPFHFLLYKRKPRTYKELPLKYAEIATLFRNEKSGELRGLDRVRQFNLADAHIICRPDQLEEEFKEVLNLINYIMETLNITDIWYRFSKWDPKDKEKYIDDPAAWDESQKMMKSILDNLKIKYIEADGEAAFYGPKLDIQYRDIYERENTLITVQIDFALPSRFNLTYVDKSGDEKIPVVIHRSSSGATERVMAYLLEKTQGKLPTWLSPIQAIVLPISEKNEAYSTKVFQELKKRKIRAELDFSQETIGKKIRNAQLNKINYMIILGDKEQEQELISVRRRDGKIYQAVKLNDFITRVSEEIKERKAELHYSQPL